MPSIFTIKAITKEVAYNSYTEGSLHRFCEYAIAFAIQMQVVDD